MKYQWFMKETILAIFALAAILLQPANAVPVVLETNLVFDGVASNDDISSPRLGEDGNSNYVVFQNNPIGPFGTGPGLPYLQRLDNSGSAVGAPLITTDGFNPTLDPDASGNYMVYTGDIDSNGVGDSIRLYDISTGSDFLVQNSASSRPLSDARVSGDVIVWREGPVVFSQRISLLGTGVLPVVYRGPVPASSDPEVGSRYIVWSEEIGSGLDKEVRAHEIFGSAFFVTPGDVDDGFDEILPTTSGNLIAFGLMESATGLSDIILSDQFAGTTTSFSLALEGLSSLSLGDDFLAFNAQDGSGVMQAFVLSLLDGGLLQLTSSPDGSSHVDIFDDLIAYTSGERLFVANLADEITVVPLPSAWLLFAAGCAFLAGFPRRFAKGDSIV